MYHLCFNNILFELQMADKIFEYHDETTTERLVRKSEESPFMVVGKHKWLSIYKIFI